MSLHAQPIEPVPEDTARVARAAFPRGNTYMALRDELGTVFSDQDFAALFPARGRPAETPWRLALVTIFQFIEGLSDRRAADAVRGRIDWKYALGLGLDDPGFDASVLCEFRARLVAGSAEGRLLDALLELCRGRGWLKARGRQRTDATHVLARARSLDRLECVVESMRHALNGLAAADPEWLRRHARGEWVERYRRRPEESRLPDSEEGRRALARQVGEDGHALLAAAYAAGAPPSVARSPVVEALRRVWVQHFCVEAARVRWRTEEDGIPPSAASINTPHDAEARYGKNRSTVWVGYKAHLTETCDDDSPHLVVQVTTAPAPAADGDALAGIYEELSRKGSLPGKHVADSGYVDAELLVSSRRDHGVELIGPTRPDYGWQALAGDRYTAADFAIDWEARRATCPQGRTSSGWTPAVERGHTEVVHIKFSRKDCKPCPARERCTRAARRSLTTRAREPFEALKAARSREATEEYRAEFARRAGIEGTISQGVRANGLRRSRHVGRAKTHLQHLATAAAINVLRIVGWLAGAPREGTRMSAFVRLMTANVPA
jgi:transposase